MKQPFALVDAPHGVLRGDVYLPENPRGCPIVVACHGFKGFKDWGFWPEAGRRFAAGGIALVTFNVSGSGIGEDAEAFTEVDLFSRNTITFELDDLGRILDAVAARELPLGGADVRKLGLLGHSRGGGVVILRAGRDRRVRAVVTWAAVSTFERWSRDDVAVWRKDGFLPILNARTGDSLPLSTAFLDDLARHGESYSPVVAMGRVEVPTLLIHGTRDEAVPPQEADRLFRAGVPGTARVSLIPGAGHTFGATHPPGMPGPDLETTLERTLSWFREHL